MRVESLAAVRGPRQLLGGFGTLDLAPRLTAELGARVFLITDATLSEQPSYRKLEAGLRDLGLPVATFSNAVADVPMEVIDRCVTEAGEHDPQTIVAFGGGTVIDLAKLTALMTVHGGSVRDYYGENRVPGPVTPLVAIPTTAGTGSEVSPVAVLSDSDQELKVGVSSPHLIPEVAVCDPATTVSCPPGVTAHTGADALCHAVESFTARRLELEPRDLADRVFLGKNDLSDDLGLRAAHLLARYLPTAVEQGGNLVAREAVMRASTLAGLAFAHAGTAAGHALQYPIGAATKTPHGLGVGLLLPYVLTSIAEVANADLERLADCVGVVGGDGFISWVADLNQRIGIPSTLREIGVEREDLPHLATSATKVTRLLQNHPGPSDEQALIDILTAAWEGDRSLLRT